MFYSNPLFKQSILPETKIESAIITLTSSESKRLIAKAVATLPEVILALKNGTVVINWGTTTAFVVEEILKIPIPNKADFASGLISQGELNVNHPETKIPPFVIKDGKPSEIHQKAALREFKPGDVFIKGANALDTLGNVGILVAAELGGSIHEAWLGINIRGGCFICPVGLEKLVPSVGDAAQKCGVFRFKYSMGPPVSMVAFANEVKAVTEVQAIKVLTGTDAFHVASGGIAGSEGSVTMVLEGQLQDLERAFDLVKNIKGEQAVGPPRRYIAPSAASVNYDPGVLSEGIQKDVSERGI
jgi:hypothetical protein